MPQVNQLYYWFNGGAYAGVGLPLNNTPGPYGHWSWAHYDERSTNLEYRYHAALSTEDYVFFNGSINSTAHLQSLSRYRDIAAQNVFGWKVVVDTAKYIALCEIPISYYACPKAPPATRRPDPGSACESMTASAGDPLRLSVCVGGNTAAAPTHLLPLDACRHCWLQPVPAMQPL